MTEISSINRQPNNLDYATNTQFRFLINKMPKTEFFVKSANIPGITLTEITQPTSLSQIKIPGNDLSYEDLTIGFLIDENFDNYIEVQNWMRGLGFPESNEQFENLLREGRDKSPQSIALSMSRPADFENFWSMRLLIALVISSACASVIKSRIFAFIRSLSSSVSTPSI